MFQGIGNLGEEYEIKLQPDAKNHSHCTHPEAYPCHSERKSNRSFIKWKRWESGRTNRVVHRNGCDSKEVRSNQNLRGPGATEF